MKTLGGSTFCWNAIAQDYCIIECLECLHEMCDQVSVVFGGTDGTVDLVLDWLSHKKGKTLHWLIITEDEWNAQQGREKLSHFSNIAIQNLSTDWIFYQQADEILHERYFDAIRETIETTTEEAFFINRLNLWATPWTMLDVPHERKPVSTIITRLFRNHSNYWCVGDAESVGAPAQHLLDINMYHMGFVRDPRKHIDKIIHMQRDVFLMDYDKRVHDCVNELFDPWKFGFTPKDIIPIREQLPKFIKAWSFGRLYPPFKDGEAELAKEFLAHINYDMSQIKILRYPDRSLVDIANDVMYSIPSALALK